MSKKNNINEFLKRNNAIFSYLKDDNGNKIGVIIATPGEVENKAPKIGFAFFEEVMDTPNPDSLYETLTYVSDIPVFANKLRDLGVSDEEIKKMKLPGISASYFRIKRFKANLINRDKTLKLARQRANTFHNRFYVDLNDEFQGSSCLYSEDDATVIYTRRKLFRCDADYCCNNLCYISANCLRKQIRSFEYRALRYYKYVPGFNH